MNAKEYLEYKNNEINGADGHKYLGYNNRHPDFPPLMNDSRIMDASWQPNSYVNNDVLRSNNIQSNWQYRQYLTKNANEIMEFNFNECLNEMGSNIMPNYNDTLGNVVNYNHSNPYMYTSILDNNMPFGNTSSDLKNIYLSREQLQSRRIAPSVNQEDLLKNGR
tara:strand:+ start:88 stop:579 length:492 start_codon:yes stop_codon:yes gene_type:complete